MIKASAPALRTFTAVTVTALLYCAPAMAAETAHGGEHGGGGLPQFDPSTYPSQIFWLLLTFGILYTVFSKKILPTLSNIIETRQNHIQGNLDTAEKLKNEAEASQAAYEALLNNSRIESTRLLTSADHAVKTRAEHQIKALNEKATREIEAVDARLATEKARAKMQMSTIAAEIASEAAARIVGIKTDLQHAQTVVDSLNKKEAA